MGNGVPLQCVPLHFNHCRHRRSPNGTRQWARFENLCQKFGKILPLKREGLLHGSFITMWRLKREYLRKVTIIQTNGKHLTAKHPLHFYKKRKKDYTNYHKVRMVPYVHKIRWNLARKMLHIAHCHCHCLGAWCAWAAINLQLLCIDIQCVIWHKDRLYSRVLNLNF